MDTLNIDQELIEKILTEHTVAPVSYGEIRLETAFDREQGGYLLLAVGWDGHKRVHGPLTHIDLKGGKFWIEYDGTEEGIPTDLLNAGVPKDRIVLAFQSLARRRYSEFAVA